MRLLSYMNELMNFDYKRAANLLKECRRRKVRREWMREPENRERRRPFHAEYARKQRRGNPQFQIVAAFHRGMRAILSGEYTSKQVLAWTAATPEEIRAHFEVWFEPGMSWENRGGTDGWQVDCVIPCENFDLTDPAQQRLCFSLANLRPRRRQHNQTKDRVLR